MEEFQTEIQDLDIFGNDWDQTGDKYLLANGLLSEVDAQVMQMVRMESQSITAYQLYF